MVRPACLVTSWTWRPGTGLGFGSDLRKTRRGIRGARGRAGRAAPDVPDPAFAPVSTRDAAPDPTLPTRPPLPDGECPGVQGTIAIARPLDRPTATGSAPPAMPSSSPALMPATPPCTDHVV